MHDLKTRFSRKEILKKCTNFEEQKDKRYIRGKVYFDIIAFSCCSSTKLSQFFFFFFCIVDKDSIRFREEVSLISWTWFTFPQKSRFKINISKKIHKIETRFWEERVMIAMVSLPLQNPCTFFVAKEENWKRIFKTKVNDPKIIQKIIYAIQSNSKLGI